MVSLPPGNHSFRVLVGEPSCPSLIEYGQTVYKKRRDLQLKADYMALNMKKFKPLQLTPRNEKVREESLMTGKSKMEDQALFQNKR